MTDQRRESNKVGIKMPALDSKVQQGETEGGKVNLCCAALLVLASVLLPETLSRQLPLFAVD